MKSYNKLLSFFTHETNINTLIVLNFAVTFALQFQSLHYNNVLVGIDIFITLLFGLELYFKIKKFGYSFLNNGFEVFDSLLILFSVISVLSFPFLERMDFLLSLRIFRLLKCTRLFKIIPNYKRLLLNFKIAAKASTGLITALMVIILLLSVMLTIVYGSVSPEYFGNPIESIYSVFRIFTIESWYEIPNSISETVNPLFGCLTKIIFSLIVFFGGIFGMSFISSIFVDEMAADNNDEVIEKLNTLIKKIEEHENKEKLSDRNKQ